MHSLRATRGALLLGLAVCQPVEAPIPAATPTVAAASPSEAPAQAPTPPTVTTDPVAPAPAVPPAISPPVVEMIAIAKGTHRRSQDNASGEGSKIVLAAYEIDRAPVSRADYDACTAAHACPEIRDAACTPDRNPDGAMRCVDFFEAQAYCAWAGKELPSEDQWERARAKLAMPRDHSDWMSAVWCMPGEQDCRPRSDWSVDGWREEMVTARARGSAEIPQPEPHERAAEVGFRCVRHSSPPSVAPSHPGPCWTSCDGCSNRMDGIADLRQVARWSTDGMLDALVTVDASGKRRGEAARLDQPAVLVAAAIPGSLVHDPFGRVVSLARTTSTGATSRELLGYDGEGNVRTRISLDPAGRRHYDYHYACWAGAAPHPDAARCPRSGKAGQLEPQTEFGRCSSDAGGRWELALADLNMGCAREEGVRGRCLSSIARGTWAVVYVPAKGRPASGPVERFDKDEIGMLERRPLGAFDFDGDGHAELVLRRMEGAFEDMDPEIEVWSFAGGATRRYAAAEAIGSVAEIDALEDVDRDGRPDLRIDGAMTIPSDGTMGDQCVGGVSSVARSLPDGTFAIDARETRADLRAQCPAAPRGKLLGDADEVDGDALTRIACAWLWGASKDDLRARLDSEWPALACVAGEFGCGCDRETLTEFIDHLPALQRRLDEP